MGCWGEMTSPRRGIKHRYVCMAMNRLNAWASSLAEGDRTGERSSPLLKWCGTTTHILRSLPRSEDGRRIAAQARFTALRRGPKEQSLMSLATTALILYAEPKLQRFTERLAMVAPYNFCSTTRKSIALCGILASSLKTHSALLSASTFEQFWRAAMPFAEPQPAKSSETNIFVALENAGAHREAVFW